MKFPTFLSIVTIMFLLVTNPLLFGQCHGGGGSSGEHSSGNTKSVKQTDATINSDELIFYDCPMHAEIKSLNPGTCSKCGMNLEQKKANIYKSEQAQKSNKESVSTENTTKFSFKVAGNCDMCKSRIEKAAKKVNGVLSADWDPETKILSVVTANNNPEAKEVSDAVTAGGYDTEFKNAPDEAYNKLPGCCKYEREKK